MRSFIVLGNKKDLDDDMLEHIKLLNSCERLHSLPSTGGVLDQDQLIMRKFDIITDARHEKEKLDEERKGNGPQGKGGRRSNYKRRR